MQNDAIDVNPVSDEEQAAPPVPTGFVLHLQPKRQGHVLLDKKVGNPGEAVDYLGVPKLSPTYAFGLNAGGDSETGPAVDSLVAQIRRDFNDPVPVEKTRAQVLSGVLKTIAVVSSRSRDYVIRFSDMEAIDGHDCYHLLLQPSRDPQKLRLRELWVDAQTFQTRQLLSAGNFTGSNAQWLVSFAEMDGAMYILSETAQQPIGVGDHRYARAAVDFESITQSARPEHQSSFFATNQTVMTEPDSANNPR